MVSELATLLGVSPETAVGMAVHDRLIALRRVDAQGDTDGGDHGDKGYHPAPATTAAKA